MTDSILMTIRPLVGVESSDSTFDDELIPAINTALSTLCQLGVGPKSGVCITDETGCWSELYQDQALNMVRTYVHLSTKLKFDPPANSFTVKALTDELDELAWRISVAVESSGGDGSVPGICS